MTSDAKTNMKKNTGRGFTHFVKAFGWSLSGFRAALKHEEAFRQELLLCLILIPLGLWITDSGVERALLVGSLLLVLIVELINSAIEAAVEGISTDRHPLAGQAKNLGSAAVFLALINALSVWFFVLIK